LLALLNATEEWLYEEGEEATKSTYVIKLAELQKLGDPITKRYREDEDRPGALEALRQTIRELIDLSATTVCPTTYEC
jgi:heat shock protein 4